VAALEDRTGGSGVPGELTTFVGRDAELRDLRARISAHRLVTLTGEGGIGKTRLAAQLCRDLEGPPGQVWWVDLGPVTDPGLVVRTVADAVGIRAEHELDPLLGIVRHLASATGLLCLDTCEHLLDEVAGLAHRVLESCENVVVLATSREALGVAGEAIYRVPSLMPRDAHRLFEDRAVLSGATFDPAAEGSDVSEICARVDGLPLAIELAAAWVHSLSPADIAAGLEESVHLLGGGPRTALPRHRALVASMDWSHDLLGPDEQRVLRRLAVFVGEFTAEAADAVAGDAQVPAEPESGRAGSRHGIDVLILTRRLVDKSLVLARRHGQQVRFRLLDTVRHYALDKLHGCGEVAQTRDRHLDHYLRLAQEAEIGSAHDQDHWRDVLDAEHDNIHPALQWALTPSRAATGRLLTATMAFQWLLRSQAQEGLGFVHRAVELGPGDRSGVGARLHVARARLAMVAGRVHEAAEAAATAEDIATQIDDRAVIAQAAAMRAYSLFFVDPAACQEHARRSASMSGAAGDPFNHDWATALEAYTLTRRDRHAHAAQVARPAYERARARRDRFSGSFLLGVELLAQLHTGDVRRAVAIGEELMELVEPLGDYFAYGSNATNVAHAYGMAGDLARGQELMGRVVQGIEQSDDVDVIAYMVTIGLLHLWSGRPQTALPWLERGIGQSTTYEWTAIRCLPPLASALRRLGRPDEAASAAARAAAAAVEVDSPQVLAAAWDEQARLTADSDPARAFDLHHRALALRREHHLVTHLPDSLDALGTLAASTGSPDAAVRMLAAAQTARDRIGYPRPPIDQPDHDRTLAQLKEDLGDKPYRERWADGAALGLEHAIAAATRGRGARDRPTSGWSSLSPTELTVAGLVADGLANPDIARRMFISRSTVKTHLAHIYAKLGTSSRTELAAITAAARDDDPGD
jgi:predicted ATPase/DNA-binding CsgD family transcriptional regulator